jgi:hypothetical protein
VHGSATRTAITSMVIVAGMLAAAAPIHAQEIEPPDQIPTPRESSWVAPPTTATVPPGSDAIAPPTTLVSTTIPADDQPPVTIVSPLPAPTPPSLPDHNPDDQICIKSPHACDPPDSPPPPPPDEKGSSPQFTTVITSTAVAGIDRSVAVNDADAVPQGLRVYRAMKLEKVIAQVIAAIQRVLEKMNH